MSIFRDTFQSDIKTELDKRQDAMLGSNRTPDVIQYLNSRNAWVRMTSSVNVNGSPELAKDYVLMGGTLNKTTFTPPQGTKPVTIYTPKSGVGNNKEAYSTKTPHGTNHRLGIKPMPGITNVEIRSKSAYGSLREAVVNFQCWDIRQLEELELLYMRPGYTVLVEWGWLPYLDSNKKIVTTPPSFYDILTKGVTPRTKIFKDLYDRCTKSGGNYDAMFGYIKNYQWSAREDGGYDCQTTIISTGEIIESLKVNFVLPDLTKLNSTTATGVGEVDSEFSNQGTLPPNTWKEHYEKNILAGVWAEIYSKLTPGQASLNSNSILKDKNIPMNFSSLATINSNDPNSLTKGNQTQIYITLEAAFDVIQKYVIPKDSAGEPLIKLSLYTEEYAGKKEPLLCVAHPTQISVDPSVCLIKSPIWYDKGGILSAVSGAVQSSTSAGNAPQIANELKTAVSTFVNGAKNTGIADFYTALQKIKDITTYVAVEILLSGPGSIQNYLSNGSPTGIGKTFQSEYVNIIAYLKTLLGNNNVQDTYTTLVTGGGFPGVPQVTSYFLNTVTITLPTTSAVTSVAQTVSSLPQAITNIQVLDTLPQNYFSGNVNGYDELGIIKNIFVNLDFLYKQSVNSNIEASDNKEKNEISLYKYLKNIMSAIQTAIGNVSNFEIHVDPVDSVARVIDINYTSKESKSNLFELQVHNTKSVVRKYSLQSQIFPEQSAIVAIGSQAKGGQLGIQNNTMIDFNKNLEDRIIKDKLFPNGTNVPDINNNSSPIASLLGSIIALFGRLADPNSTVSVPVPPTPTPLPPFPLPTPPTPPTPSPGSPFPFPTPLPGQGGGFFPGGPWGGAQPSPSPVPFPNTQTTSNVTTTTTAVPSTSTTSTSTVAQNPGVDLNTLFTRSKSSLRDLIVYFQSITKSDGANRNIIPIKFSFEMDGIGGLVIGNLFTINDDILPKGYKSANLAQTVTGIGHTIGNGDWVTKVDALNIILDRRSSGTPFSQLDLKKIVQQSFQSVLFPTATGGTGGSIISTGKGTCTTPYIDKNLLPGGWLGKQVPIVTTVIDPAIEGPKLVQQYGKTLAQSILAVIKKEQSFRGFNWNLGGFDITSGRWKFDPIYHVGYVVAREGGTNLCKAYVAFKDFQSFIVYKANIFKQRGFDKITSPSDFAQTWYIKWNGRGALKKAKNPNDKVELAALEKAALAAAAQAWNDVAQYVK